MRHAIIGTAGHVDHGKTTLIQALTGVNTDRLKQEKERGLTIELGFAPLALPSGVRAGVVDVPGHERFVKNMLAGATGIDVALLVVAADEGVMPQTDEHLDILNLLGVGIGVVAVTKCDMVDDEWLELVVDDVRQRLEGTVLEGSEIVAVSAVARRGIDELLAALDRAVERAVAGEDQWSCARLPVDRVFSIQGHGTVVTGTLVGGTIRPGDKLELLPPGETVRVRGVQVHDTSVDEATRGLRVALNLAGLEKAEVSRGMVLATPGVLEPARLIDAELRLLDDARAVEHGERMHLHIGTDEVTCRVRVIGADAALPGERSFVQIEVEEGQVVAARGDRFVLRTYSPMVTSGGGRVLAVSPGRTRRFRAESMAEFRTLASDDDSDLALLFADRIMHDQRRTATASQIARAMFCAEETVQQILKCQVEKGMAVGFGDSYMSVSRWRNMAEGMTRLLEAFHRDEPLRVGMPKEELRTRAFPDWEGRAFAPVLAHAIRSGLIKECGTAVCMPEHEVILSEADREWAHSIEAMFSADPMSPPERATVMAGGAPQAVLDYLIETGVVVRVGSELMFHASAISRAARIARELGADGKAFTAGQFRDACGNSRKFAVALLEYLDSSRVTRRVGDERVLA